MAKLQTILGLEFSARLANSVEPCW